LQRQSLASQRGCHEQGLFGREGHKLPGLLLWKGKTGGEMGEERSVTGKVEAAGCDICHDIVNAGNRANGERAGLD
jgi:hypothetical protein